MIKYPKILTKNSTIGITATSGIADQYKIDLAEQNLQNQGFQIIETSNVRQKVEEELVSSSGKTRAQELMSLWNDSKVSLILTATGGEFLMEMLPYLEEHKEEIAKDEKPKWVQGYSDTSLLNFYLTTNYHIATLHARNAGTFAMKNYHEALQQNIDFWLGKEKELTQYSYDRYQIEEIDEINLGYHLTEQVQYKSMNSQENVSFEGRMIGGCIDVLCLIIGTKYDHTLSFLKECSEGVIWYLDNCELSMADLYRALWKMKDVGYFQNTKGILMGRSFVQKDYAGFSYLKVLEKTFDKLAIPVIYDVDIGHVPPQWTIVNGSYGIFEYQHGQAKLIQKLI